MQKNPQFFAVFGGLARVLSRRVDAQSIDRHPSCPFLRLSARADEESEHIPEKQCHGGEELDRGGDVGVFREVPHD